MNFRKCIAVALACLLGVASFLLPTTASAQPSVTGQWTRLNDLPFGPIHQALMPDGKVLMWARNNNMTYVLFDPVTQTVSPAPNAGYDQFCAGHAYLSDGRLLVAGGHVVDFVGLAHASLFDTKTSTWTPAPDMNAGRWYPTVTTLANGDALVVSGQIDTTVGVNPLPQVYQAATNTWRSLTNAQLNQDLYPMMFLAPNGKVLNVGPSNTTRYLDTSGTGAWTVLGDRIWTRRDYGSAVMYDTGKILMVAGGENPPNGTAEVIDLNDPTPTWRFTGYLAQVRRHVNTTLLPDGTALATGGTYGYGDNNMTTPVLWAELWNPATELWTVLASQSVGRFYHSSALLLPDGRVLSVGGDDTPAAEIFSPPYLFKGARPTMSAVPATINYGQQFSVQSPDATAIGKVTLIRLSSPTHAFDQNQRMNVLQYTVGSGAVNITPPANANLAPPGLYLLFLVNSTGVPSIGSVVKLGGTASPPVVTPALTSIAPNSATAGGAAFTLTASGSNFVSGSTVRWNGAARTTTFLGTTQLSAAVPATDIAAAGTAQVTVRNPDGTVVECIAVHGDKPSPRRHRGRPTRWGSPRPAPRHREERSPATRVGSTAAASAALPSPAARPSH